jgi:DHA2 family multidrug resistance protein
MPESSDNWKPKYNPWLIAVAVCMPTFMEVLDSAVANVALPHIAGSLSATNDEATWVLTSYLVSNAIVLPCSDWLGRTFGRKRFLMTCILIFTIASALAGAATSLGMLIMARVLQGLGGGALQPVSQSILQEGFTNEQRGSATALFGVVVVVAPIIGPILGGWITDNYSWRWIFYINLPIGILALAAIFILVEDPPYLQNLKKTRLDWMGLVTMALWLSTFQIAIDKGQDLDWFQSSVIVALAWTSFVCLMLFLWRQSVAEHPLVDFSVLRNANCLAAVFFNFILGLVLYAANALLPLFLQSLMGYSAFQSGLSVAPRGVGAFISFAICGRLVNFIDARKMAFFGFVGLGISVYMLGAIDLDITARNVQVPIFLSGCCMGLIFLPLTIMNVSSLPPQKFGAASGLSSLSRNLGGGVGISLSVALVSHLSQMHQTYLVPALSPANPMWNAALQSSSAMLHRRGIAGIGTGPGYAVYSQILTQQSTMLSYLDGFHVMGVLCLVAAPLMFFAKKSVKKAGAEISAH